LNNYSEVNIGARIKPTTSPQAVPALGLPCENRVSYGAIWFSLVNI